jgi:hypothetical protein
MLRYRTMFPLTTLLLLATLGAFAQAQEGETNEETDKTTQRMEALLDWPREPVTTNVPGTEYPYAPAGVELSPENQALQQESIREYFHHIMESNRHQRDVFHWQLFSARIIFASVILLVVAGIYFAAVQFHHGLKQGRSTPGETEFEASLKGIKVSSPVLGVTLLTISLAIFYLYLVHVCPIEFVGG